MDKNIKQKAVSGVIWSAVERFSTQFVQFVLTLIIARILLPEDYGLIAMLQIFIVIAQSFVDSGFSSALIQKKDCSEIDYSTAFISNIGISIASYALIFFVSPYIARFYEIPSLEIIAKVISLNILISAFGIVQRTRLTIQLNFKTQALASLISIIISGIIAIIMALKGFGVWALVVQLLSNNLFNILLLWVYAKWKPSLRFSKASFKTLFRFGSKLLLSAILNNIYTNLYTLIIGKKFSGHEAGLYNRANILARFPTENLTSIIIRAVYPIQCQMQDDEEALKSSFINYQRLCCFIIFPIIILLCVLAEPITLILLTEKWLAMVPILQILCIAFMWIPVMSLNHNIITVKGRSDWFLQAEVYKKVVGILILLCTLPFGLNALCAGLILYSFADMFIITRYSKRILGFGLFFQLKTLFPILALALLCGSIAAVTAYLFTSVWFKLSIAGSLGLLSYIGIAKLTHLKEYDFMRELFHKHVMAWIKNKMNLLRRR